MNGRLLIQGMMWQIGVCRLLGSAPNSSLHRQRRRLVLQQHALPAGLRNFVRPQFYQIAWIITQPRLCRVCRVTEQNTATTSSP